MSKRERAKAHRSKATSTTAQRLTLIYVERMLRALADLVRRLIDGG